MKIFISWSKKKSKRLASATKFFLEQTLNNSVDFFFSPEMYKGTRSDNEIHKNLLESDKCLLCITAENFKNPWLLYEAGVVFGANYLKNKDEIVIPILFENIPEWSSWIDKPLNRYVPIQLQSINHEFESGKKDLEFFLKKLAKELQVEVMNFEENWDKFVKEINEILTSEKIIPAECEFLITRLLENESDFAITSPEITKGKIGFHKGFTTHILTRLLTDFIVMQQSKSLWIFGRKNKKLLSREFEPFFLYLANEGLKNGIDFRCLFPLPKSKATIKASSKDREQFFEMELEQSLKTAFSLKNKFGLPVEKIFKLYSEPRKDSIIIIDNAVLYHPIICDDKGYPLPYTDSNFEVLTALETKGNALVVSFENVWNSENTIPLTEDLLLKLYN